MRAWCLQRRYDILFTLLMFCIACHDISKSYGFYFPADEFGYWSYAARLAGYDWSDIASLSSYYSYGYSLILLPVFLLVKDAVAAYRTALFVNFALLTVCFFLLQKIGKTFYAAVAAFYPTWLFYAGTTFAEILIVTLYLLTCALLLKYLQTEQKRYLALLCAVMCYLYFVHMRTVGVLVSGIAVLVIHSIRGGGKKVKYMLALAVGMAFEFAAGILVKKYWTSLVYTDAGSSLLDTNDYAGQIDKIAFIFTKEGFMNLITSLSGKLLYLGLAGFGTAYMGIVYAVRGVRKGKYFPLFVLISALAAVLICAIYTIHPGRVDALTYGRYHEYVMPVLMMMGIKELRTSGMTARKAVCGIAVILVLEAAMTGLVTFSLRQNGQTSFFGNTVCGISWLYDAEKFEPVSFYWRVYFVHAVLTFMTGMGVWWTGRQRGREVFLMVLVAVQVAIGIRLSTMYIDASRLGCYRDTLIVQKIQELNPEGDRAVYYSTDGLDFGNVGILQFMMRDTAIQIVKTSYELDAQNESDLLLIDYRSGQAQALEERYSSHLTNGHFTLYYNGGGK